MQKITKVVIPAAGYGTRFLPETKAIPKEMLPVVDKPIIQYVVEEAINSGIKNMIIVTNAGKHSIEDHFSFSGELDYYLEKNKKPDLQQQIRKISETANFIYLRQSGGYGNGTPVLNAKNIVGNESFAVSWGDEFIYARPERLKQMIDVYEKYGGMVISGVKIDKKEDLKKYGIADIEHIEKNIYKIKKIVEKPEPSEAPSNIATHGAYILPPEIFSVLEKLEPGKGGEIWLTDAINKLKDSGVPLYTVLIENGKYCDCGNKLEYLKTNIDFALKHEEIGKEFKEYLKKLKL